MNRRRIELREVAFGYYRNTPVLRDVNLTIDAGLTLVLGPNGCGKSTLLKLAAGVEMPDRGSVAIHGHDLWSDEVEARRDLAYLPEEPDLTPYASLLEILRLVCRLRNEPPDRADEALATAGLSGLGGRSVRQLSKGQRRRALLAAAWIGRPRTLLLDEPLDAVDRNMQQHLINWLGEVRSESGLALVVSHDIGPLAGLADRAVAVHQGHTVLVEDLPLDRDTRLPILERLARGELE
jgi:ABC-2 type transport system ATP-binding protein